MADDLLHGLAGEVGTEHIDLVGHSAVDEIVPQVDAVFLAEGSSMLFTRPRSFHITGGGSTMLRKAP